MTKGNAEFYNLLATRILYQLERGGLSKIQGETVDEITENTRKARLLVTEMLINDEEPK